MLHYDEIKDIIVNKLGIKDLPSYKQYMASWQGNDKPRIITKQDVELLSPDNVHNGDFWKIVEEIFGVDGVADTQYGKYSADRDETNRRTMRLARISGALNVIDLWQHHNLSVLEIGAGYGSFKYYVLNNTAFSYMGVDTFPKVEGVVPTLPNGLLPDAIKQIKFNLIYSSNVFQHLSSKQRLAYLNDVKGMLHNGGCFVFNLFLTIQPPRFPSEDGKAYGQHYGQFTEIPTYREFVKILSEHYWVDVETRRMEDDLFTFVCRPKESTSPQAPA